MTAPARQLWRLSSTSAQAPPEMAALSAGLQLHVRNSGLDCIVVQIGAVQQRYVALKLCNGCARGRCEPGCEVELLRRLLAQHASGLQLERVAGGLAARPYCRVVLALPRANAVLSSELLRPWPEARLIVRWRPGRRQHIQASAVLVVGGDGPDPGQIVRSQGWLPWPIPRALGLRWASAPVPPALPFGRPLRASPALLLPTTTPPATVLAPPRTFTSGLDEPLTTWLSALLANPTQAAEELTSQPQEGGASAWPAGPDPLAPAALGTLVAQLIAEPSFQSTRKGQAGLSKGRLAGLKYPGLSENVARALMVWFDRAGVLAPPEEGQGLWRAPRPFALTDLEQIAAKLRDTPLPTSEEIRAAYGGET